MLGGVHGGDRGLGSGGCVCFRHWVFGLARELVSENRKKRQEGREQTLIVARRRRRRVGETTLKNFNLHLTKGKITEMASISMCNSNPNSKF